MDFNINGNSIPGQNAGGSGSLSASGQVQQGQAGVVNGTVNASPNAGGVVRNLANLMAGDAFNGEVTMLEGNNVTLTLGDGSLVNASLKGDASVMLGQNLTFVVQQNDGNTVTLKSMQQISDQTAYVASKALEAAGLAETPSNLEMVQELLNHNMSINSQTLNDMAKACIRYPEAGLDTLARLQKLDIPITRENIEQFEAYKSYENRLDGELTSLTSGLTDYISSQADGGGAAVAEASSRILDILYGTGQDVGDVAASQEGMENAVERQDVQNAGAQQDVPNAGVQQDTVENEAGMNVHPAQADTAMQNGEPISSMLSEASRNRLSEMLGEAVNGGISDDIRQQLLDGGLSARDALGLVNELIKNNETDGAALKNMLESKEYSGLMEMVMRDTMRISPADVKDKKNIRDFYAKVLKSTDELAKLVDEKDMNDTQLAKSISDVRDNVEFMNELNRNMTYIQMPIKFSENNGNGELYVFTNKKSLRQNKDEVSALLHLDMENLGPVDVFVKLRDKNVTTNFCLESEEMLDFVNEHIDQLNARLEALGYNCRFDMNVRGDDKGHVDFVGDFLDAGMPAVTKASQLMFDRKV
jgi:hypothetical protein